MKNYINIAVCALAALGLAACSEEKVIDVNTAAIPLITDYADNFQVTVDQETNNATFTFTGRDAYPVWIIDGKSYSTDLTFTRYYRKAGDYAVEVKVGNSNGISQGALPLSFHIDKTAMSGFGGFNFEYEHNLWLTATRKINSFFYAPGWAQLPDPSYTFTDDAFSVTLPAATTDQWQAQCHIGTDICLTAGEHYDGSFIFTSNVNITQAVLKIHPDGDDDDAHSFFPNQKIRLTAGEPTTFWFSDLEAAVDMNNLVFTLDFGGNPENAEISVENFVIKNHIYDDGTVLPELPKTPEPNWAAWDSPDNLLMSSNFSFSFYYAPGWSPLPDPTVTSADGVYTIDLPSATFEQWQAQWFFNTDLAIDNLDQEYDFHIAFESNVDVPSVMVKLTDTDNDKNYFFAETVALTGGARNTFWQAAIKAPAAMGKVSLVLDFGGNPDGTTVKVSEICFQKHKG